MPELIPRDDAEAMRKLHAPIEWGYGPVTKQPYVTCCCGWESSARPRWWEEVGAELDEHISKMKWIELER
jgi:hypothetical protein